MFVLIGLVRCEIVLLHLNVIFTSVCSQTYKELANIKSETKCFPAVTLVQFCVSKSPPFNVTSLIGIQLACNNTAVVNTLHPELIGRLHINRFLFLTQSECHAKYIHSLFINSTHIAHIILLISSHTYSNISTLLK